MKKLLILLLVIISLQAQGQNDSLYGNWAIQGGIESSDIDWSSLISTQPVATITPTYTVCINSPSGKTFCIDFSKDSLTSTGELIPDEHAKQFINALYLEAAILRTKEIERLNKEIALLKSHK